MDNQKQSFYSWKPDEQFSMMGIELEYYLGVLNEKLSSPYAKEIISAYEFKKLLDKKVEEGFKDGKITEKTPD